MTKQRGFTLVELLVVVLIIGVLAAMMVPKFSRYRERSYLTAMKSDLRNLASAEESFYFDSGRYSGDIAQLHFSPTRGVGDPVIDTFAGAWSARISDARMPGVTCGIGVWTANPVVAGAANWEPACQD